MFKIKINGVNIEMPHEPYPAQLVTMGKLIECFQTNTNSLIESPTGTGKSFSIICSVLAYNEHMKRQENYTPVKIYICSRTHKQLDQLVAQLRKTIYKPRISILGSRTQYCINSRLTEVFDKNKGCADLLKMKNCLYFNGKERLVKKMGEKIFDIEELKVEGKKCSGCPYFAAKLLQQDADVIFCPYNYLVETAVRESSEIVLDNSIVIIDEAHNIEDCCRTAGSIEITSKILEIVINEIVGCIKRSALLGDIQLEFINLMEIFRKLKEYSTIQEFDQKSFEANSRIRKGKTIIDELGKIGITKERFLVFKNAMQMILKNENSKSLLDINAVRLLQEMERTIGMVLFTGTDAYAYCFTKSNKENTYVYNFWLLDPSIMFLPLVSKVKSISLLSGTLTPFSSFTSELKYTFQHKVIAPHILKKEQVFVSCIKRGHLKRELLGTYSTTETIEYLDQIAQLINKIAEETRPFGGTLVFVPSYSFLYKLSNKLKDVVVETKEGMTDFEKKIEVYRKRISEKKTSIFLCVYRGKASEGIDFKDEFARSVIAVGLPYPSVRDPQIGCKKEYNDKGGGYNGRLWYEAQAFRAVNQALGRAIRHSKDWGSIFLLDSRYTDKRIQGNLPNWISTNMKIYETFEACKGDFKEFLKISGDIKNNK